MAFTLVFLLSAALPADADSSASIGRADDSAAAAPRRYHEINNDIRDALRAEAHARTQDERAAAIKKMCELHDELAHDPRLQLSGTLKSYKAKLWSRMTRVKKDLERHLPESAEPSDTELGNTDLAAMAQVTSIMAEQVGYLHSTMGGPSYVFSQSGGTLGGGMVRDHSQELIDLIQRTIKPDHWDVAGGPGSMFYFRPLMALVVRATSEVHGDVGGLLDALRRAGQ
ncbi:MAG: hypothetical protein JJ992_25410 [Planctomycetes bacterium]|nr:hypothetical protein [Planctomycetota bacterium]